MPLPVFSDEWARACAARINQRPGYREAAASWEGAILLAIIPDSGDGRGALRVFLDLWHGDCRVARAAIEEDEALARFILAGPLAAWRAVLTGGTAPLFALMTGRLKLTKGNLAELLPHVVAAKELVAAAAEVEASYPERLAQAGGGSSPAMRDGGGTERPGSG
jgi:putative sterol carrier protein